MYRIHVVTDWGIIRMFKSPTSAVDDQGHVNISWRVASSRFKATYSVEWKFVVDGVFDKKNQFSSLQHLWTSFTCPTLSQAQSLKIEKIICSALNSLNVAST